MFNHKIGYSKHLVSAGCELSNRDECFIERGQIGQFVRQAKKDGKAGNRFEISRCGLSIRCFYFQTETYKTGAQGACWSKMLVNS
jgi:hypothetical protein